jgi:hypothetical protein
VVLGAAGHVIVGRGSSTDGYAIYVDGVLATPASTPAIVSGIPACRVMAVGAQAAGYGSSTPWYVAELWWYSTPHTDPQRNSAEAALKAKWATP